MKEGEKALIVANDNLPSVNLNPRQEIHATAEAAKALQEVVDQCKLSRDFGGDKEHLFFEAWQTIGSFYNCTPMTEWTKPIWHNEKIVGWEARVNIINGDGRIIGAAESMCAKDEPNWKNKPQYALRSMAQTRAGSKALRSVFARVAVLAGYAATPAEEMSASFIKNHTATSSRKRFKSTEARSNPKVEDIPKDSTGKPEITIDPQAKDQPKPSPAPITNEQKKQIYALCIENELGKEEAKEFYHFVLGKEKATKEWASDVISNFPKYFELFVDFKLKNSSKNEKREIS